MPPITNFCLAILIVFLTCSAGFSGDWPQILGPNRNCQTSGEKLADSWDAQKPEKLWEFKAGQGYAGPAVKDNRVLVFHRVGRSERLDCIDTKTGDELWQTEWKATYGGGVDSDQGPRCVPLIAGDRVFVFGAGGDLHAAKFSDGGKLWSRALAKEYDARDGYFGFGSSPIVIGNHLMVNVGGRTKRRVGNAIVSVDPSNGKTQWTAVDDDASYAAPIASPDSPSAANEASAVFVSRFKLTGLRPSDGKVLYELPFGKSGPTVNGASPVLLDEDRLFLTASYGIGGMCVSVKATDDPKVIWKSDDVLSSQYPTPAFAAGHLFGVHGREDGAPASLRCVDPETKAVKWKQDRVGMAHVIVADKKLLVMTTEGELRMVELSSEAYREKGRAKIASVTTRALPALSNGRFFVKDNGGTLTAWKLPSRE